MSMTPINRIPKMDSGMTLGAIANTELSAGRISLAEQLEALHTHSSDENHLSCTLDWAMEIRNELGISWEESIDLAMTLYFG